MSKPVSLWVDQYGDKIYARTQNELRRECGGGRVAPMYCDKKDGRTVRVGVVVGRRWFTQWQAVETPIT